MSIFDVIAERKIQQAIERGEFDGLPFQGIPIDICEDFSVPVTLRFLMARVKSAPESIPEDSPLMRYWVSRRYRQKNAEISRAQRDLKAGVNLGDIRST